MEANKKPGFGITHSKGFHVTFDNGVTLSTQFGASNYCANRDFDGPLRPGRAISCPNAEIAVWDKAGNWLTKQAYAELGRDELYDDVDGWITPNQWAELVNWCANHR